MTIPSNWSRTLVLAALGLVCPILVLADDPPTPPISEARKAVEAIQPLPQIPIPDNPPPHEGAMFDLPYIIEPPDIVIVEVLEALPGRPITGERLVRSDGKISLGFYGEIPVRGLTIEQVKVKVILHLRSYLNDENLGLVKFAGDDEAPQPLPKAGSVIEGAGPAVEPMPDKAIPAEPEGPGPGKNPFVVPESKPKPDPAPRPIHFPRKNLNQPRQGRTTDRLILSSSHRPRTAQVPGKEPAQDPKPAVPEEMEVVIIAEGQVGPLVAIDPVDSSRIFVDIAAHNTHAYFVQGDVGVPGRMPFTGKETVLDAINYAGGLTPSANPQNIHLFRPSRGDQPAKDYQIQYDALLKGDITANLQLFPRDRLVIGRK